MFLDSFDDQERLGPFETTFLAHFKLGQQIPSNQGQSY